MNNIYNKVLLLILIVGTVTSCHVSKPLVHPIKSYEYISSTSHANQLIVFLPGIHDDPSRFLRHDFISAAKDAGVLADYMTVDSHIGYFKNLSIVERLHSDIILPAQEAGYESIWLVGTSLGGFASLLYVAEHAEEIDGVVLLAPYLGSEDIVADIVMQGGLDQWGARTADGPEIETWIWLRKYLSLKFQTPALYLGYGEQDKFLEAHELLAGELNEENVFHISGGHDWNTWRKLWRGILKLNLFVTKN